MGSSRHLDLSAALERGEVVPYFQPIVELRTGKLSGFEVLSRWKHPVVGMISPDKFIPLAESTGLIGQLTDSILRQAFAAVAMLPTPLSLSVNISPIQFRDDKLPSYIEQAIRSGGFDFERLILEVTESALLDNMLQARKISMGLKELGIRLALDDFGTGYSSLRHLQALPFDELKVDGSFVRSMDHTRESRKIAAAVVGLGHSLGLTTVAEGIETRAQAEMLLWLGCDLGQGWLYSRAVPAGELSAIVARENLLPDEDAPAGSTLGLMLGSPRLEALPAQQLAQLQAIYDGAPVGLCFIDTNMRYMSINKLLAEMNGASVAQHIGHRVGDLFPELFKIVGPYIRIALQGQSVTGLEVRYPKSAPDGGLRTLLLSYQPARDEADEVVGVSVAVVDITERKQAEEALRKSEDHYRRMVELNPHIPWTASPDFTEIEVSPKWEKLTGMTQAEMSDHGWLSVVHPEDARLAQDLVGECIRSGLPLDLELRVKRADGSWIWMRSRGAPLRDEAGDVLRWYGSMEDVDDRKKVEETLIESETLLKAVFDAVPVGIVVANAPEGRVVMSNPQAKEIFKRTVEPADAIDEYRKSGAIRSDGRILKHEDFPLERAIATGQPVGPEELFYRRVNGSEGWISSTAIPVHDRNGEVVGGVLAVLDIDEMKREKQALTDRVSELERHIDELENPKQSAGRKRE